METRNNILSELQSLSPLVAGIVPVNPYQIPEGYFENFPAIMVQLVQEDKSSELLAGAQQNPYTVPENYFRDFPAQILTLAKDEKPSMILQDASDNPYQLPQGYFENLPSQIIARIKVDDLSAKEELELLSPLLSKLDKKIPFSTPAGYFHDLTETVMTGTKAIEFVNEELENLSPLLNGLKSKNVYTVPQGYFEGLTSILLDKVKEQRPAKVMQMNFGKKVMKYAAAAIITGIIVIGGILFLNRQSSSVNTGTIAQAEEKLQQETQNKVKELTDDELVNFIEDQPSSLPDFLNLTNTEIDSEDIKTMLADIPDAELKQYLDEYSSESEVLNN